MKHVGGFSYVEQHEDRVLPSSMDTMTNGITKLRKILETVATLRQAIVEMVTLVNLDHGVQSWSEGDEDPTISLCHDTPEKKADEKAQNKMEKQMGRTGSRR